MDHLVPRFHIRPPHGFLNDPNGPVLLDGVLHLYYQYRATTDLAEPVSWGHASSADLVHWTHHRPAMAPLPGGDDSDGCWSGNTVPTDEGLRAFYSGHREGEPLQATLTALSRDGGATFGPPSPVAPPPEGLVQFRDPFVWSEDGRWRMALGAGTADGVASIRTWESPDLEQWRPADALVELPRTVVDGVDTGAMWECPQVLEVEGTTVALVGAWGADTGIMRVLAVLPGLGADRLGGVGAHPVDDGTAFYAPSVLRDGPRGPLVLGWITEDRDDAWWAEDGWAGTIALPRELRLGEGGRMLSALAPEVDALRLGDGTDVPAGGLEGLPAQVEVLVRAPIGGGVRVVFGADEALEVRIDHEGTAIVDRSASSSDPRAHREEIRMLGAADEDGSAELRILLDGSVVEMYTATGRVATTRVYPTTAPPWGVRALEGSTARVWELG